MAAYHSILAHFPIALLFIAYLIILLRLFSQAEWLCKLDPAITVLLGLGVLSGLLTFASGLMVWPIDAITHSPASRNHLLMASWTWVSALILFVVWYRSGNRLLAKNVKWLTLSYLIIGMTVLMITGTLGGNLASNPSSLPAILAKLGWDLNWTYYYPVLTVILIIVTALVAFGLSLFNKTGENQS